VDQVGVACHTGERTCFFRTISADGPEGVDTDAQNTDNVPLS
jgi:hypothetical protein